MTTESRRDAVVRLWHLGVSLAAIGRTLKISSQAASKIALDAGLRRKPLREPETAPDCLCGTGSYCHRHREYRLPPPPKNKDGTPKKSYELRLVDEAQKTSNQQCGGGRRINHKRIGEI